MRPIRDGGGIMTAMGQTVAATRVVMRRDRAVSAAGRRRERIRSAVDLGRSQAIQRLEGRMEQITNYGAAGPWWPGGLYGNTPTARRGRMIAGRLAAREH